jgi:hypothetical protein
MSLPKGDEKAYLDIVPTEGGFTIQAEGQHAGELQALFRQHGINCRLHPELPAPRSDLVFSREADVSQAREILEAYKNPKGS